MIDTGLDRPTDPPLMAYVRRLIHLGHLHSRSDVYSKTDVNATADVINPTFKLSVQAPLPASPVGVLVFDLENKQYGQLFTCHRFPTAAYNSPRACDRRHTEQSYRLCLLATPTLLLTTRSILHSCSKRKTGPSAFRFHHT